MIGRTRTSKTKDEAKPKSFDDFDMRLGDVMRGERATMGKSLLDVQRELKIKATYISAIENSDPTAFETQGFIAGYVRSYARYLGLDPEWAYATFCDEGGFENPHGMAAEASEKKYVAPMTASGAATDPFTMSGRPFAPVQTSVMSRLDAGALGSLAVLIALVGGIGFGGFSILREVQRVDFAPIDQSPGVAGSIDPLLVSDLDIAAPDAPTQSAALDRLYRPQALEVPILEARDAPIASLDPSNFGVFITPPTPSQNAPTPDDINIALAEALGVGQDIQVIADDVPEVTLFAMADAWVQVKSPEGSVIFENIMKKGEEYVLPKTELPPILRAGNAGGVYFRLNGQAYGPAGGSGAVIKNVPMEREALSTEYALVDLQAAPEVAAVVAELSLPAASQPEDASSAE